MMSSASTTYKEHIQASEKVFRVEISTSQTKAAVMAVSQYTQPKDWCAEPIRLASLICMSSYFKQTECYITEHILWQYCRNSDIDITQDVLYTQQEEYHMYISTTIGSS